MNPALIIFIKNPVAGKVKTRLAATMGNEEALHIYLRLLEHTFSITQHLEEAKYLFYSDFIPNGDVWQDAGYRPLLQSGPDLGLRMQHAFETIFAAGHTKAVIIGSDCINLETAMLEQAFSALDAHDVVIGPANDGGYYLLGMKSLHPLFFRNKEWSTPDVFPQTVQDCQREGLSFLLLPELVDIDTEEDWLLFGARSPTAP
jgi:rSAM/selenodomain-associated transferase 1